MRRPATRTGQLWAWAAAGCLLAGCENAPPVTQSVETPTAPAPEQVSTAEPADTTGAPFTTTASGLKYRVLREGAEQKPQASSTVKVNYKGWLDNGEVFDSSYDRGEPISFPLRGVIPGWTEGLQLVGVGGMIELEIPSELGYGAQGSPPVIPPNATLHFQVELLDVQ